MTMSYEEALTTRTSTDNIHPMWIVQEQQESTKVGGKWTSPMSIILDKGLGRAFKRKFIPHKAIETLHRTQITAGRALQLVLN